MKRTTTFGFISFLALILVLLPSSSNFLLHGAPSPPETTEGLEVISDTGVCGGDLKPGETAVIQAIDLGDSDDDDEPVSITEAEITNQGDATGEDIESISILNEEDTSKGSTTVYSFPTYIYLNSFQISDDGSGQLKVEVTLSNSAESGVDLQIDTTIVHEEGNTSGFHKSSLDGCYETIKSEESTTAKFRVNKDGNVFADGDYYGNKFKSGNADLAEKVKVSESVQPGDVIGFNPDNPKVYRKTRRAYSPFLAGVVSSKPGMILSDKKGFTSGNMKLALLGTVPVKVTAINGPITPGDLLTPSPKPGHAMVCKDKSKCSGSLIGKALESFKGNEGKIRILLTG